MPSTLQTPYFEPAYQLHHYLIFRTHYLREMFHGNHENDLIDRTLQEVCEREKYHLLERQIAVDHVRLLVSLTPDQIVSQAVQRFKSNISRQFSLVFPNRLEQNRMPALWAEDILLAVAEKSMRKPSVVTLIARLPITGIADRGRKH